MDSHCIIIQKRINSSQAMCIAEASIVVHKTKTEVIMNVCRYFGFNKPLNVMYNNFKLNFRTTGAEAN